MHTDELSNRVTRGHGYLEGFLARLRARKANDLIPDHLRQGKILDIGCGSSPYFLSHTFFEQKFAIDQFPLQQIREDVQWFAIDLNKKPNLPFPDDYFSVTTMLAVVEHLDPDNLVDIFREIHRVLIPGGWVILTTPAAWSDRLLRTMARLQLVSAEEIDEHKFAYTLPLLGWYFGAASFEMKRLRFGYFEFFLNMWATATK